MKKLSNTEVKLKKEKKMLLIKECVNSLLNKIFKCDIIIKRYYNQNQ